MSGDDRGEQAELTLIGTEVGNHFRLGEERSVTKSEGDGRSE